MNDNHQRHLLVTFRHIDNLLSEAERVLATAGSASPFAEYTQDSTPVQRKVVHDYIQRVRAAMRRGMGDLNLPRPAPVCGALWAARGHITFASIAVAEMEPKRMRGYGALTEADSRAIDGVVAELNAALGRLAAYFDKGPDAELQARLQKLEQTRDEVRLLRELERVITAHGLVELRGALAMLLDRLENGAFEIGLFGRVSSGKSSLLNHLLGAEVLPVGVTPVTAIPTRVTFGAKPQAVIEFAESKPLVVELARLAEFSTEQHNPGNARHVARIQAQLPARRLREGVTFVDTPGLGSLATAGAEETVAYLPRCDLGIVLIDAGSTLTHEDLTVVQALYQSGAKAMVVVSKADLLSPAERQQMAGYAAGQLATQLHLELPVHLVSVVGADAALCDQWLQNELMPLVEAHRQEAAAALKRKAGGLREAVVTVLQTRLQRGSQASPAPSRQRVEETLAALRKADALLEAAQREGDGLVEGFSTLADGVIEAAAADLARVWMSAEGKSADIAKTVSASVHSVLAARVAKLVERLAWLRSQLGQALQLAEDVLPLAKGTSERLPLPAGAPIADTAGVRRNLVLKRPVVLSSLGAALLRRHTRSRLAQQLRETLPELLNPYRQQVRQWFRQSLAELRAAFAARAGFYRLQLEQREAVSAPETSVASLETDLRLLQETK
jgi:GTP-binding protein EngB required for normal cell division/cell division septum initiation protein DivIVA